MSIFVIRKTPKSSLREQALNVQCVLNYLCLRVCTYLLSKTNRSKKCFMDCKKQMINLFLGSFYSMKILSDYYTVINRILRQIQPDY